MVHEKHTNNSDWVELIFVADSKKHSITARDSVFINFYVIVTALKNVHMMGTIYTSTKQEFTKVNCE